MKNCNNLRHRHGGFTLIELLISVAILAVLTIMAGAAYSSFAAKAQAAEGLQMLAGPKLSWETAYLERGGRPPLTLTEAGISQNLGQLGAKFVTGINVNSSGIQIIYDVNEADAPLGGTSIQLIPYETPTGSIIWTCEGGPVPDPLDLNVVIAGTGAGAAIAPTHTTTSPASVVPALCRT